MNISIKDDSLKEILPVAVKKIIAAQKIVQGTTSFAKEDTILDYQ